MTGRAVTVRRARGGDAPAIAAMLRALNTEPGLRPDRLTEEVVRRALIEDARSLAWIAEVGAAAAGVATAHATFDTGRGRWVLFLSDLWVEPAHRRRGVGRALVSAAAAAAAAEVEEAAAAAEAPGGLVWWNADAGDAAAIAFHRRLATREAPTLDFTLETP